ncbi:MAG: helicase [Novosphingobium lindaniclasticum]|uniref:DUF3320 domain-containing protein n=1 Tax=Novosphingobium lindaniclasticum TaxID=1329895 RepID=UPI0024099C54|nr:DUF3320 domain-containing protein [Novosphingobium lindaniclasticum]MDF2637960.1 helicase [Novosphingobium lindaniclasticum]
MSSRPYIGKSASGLEQIVRDNRGSSPELRLVLAELRNRKTLMARRLADEVQALLVELADQPDQRMLIADLFQKPVAPIQKDRAALPIRISAAVADKIGFASHQNAVPILRDLEIHHEGEAAYQNLTIHLSANPPFLSERTWRIDELAPGTSLHVTDRDVALDASFLGNLSESIQGSATLRIEAGGEVLALSTFPVELLARNQWGGVGSMGELLPAFVMPNDPAVDRILKAASDVLRRAGKRDAINGYEDKSRTRTWELTSAIWSAVCGLRLSYALPPASFERVGQKVRTPSAVLDGGMATCLDTSLLFAAALEQAGLNPLLILTGGHAFAGVWLQPIEFSTLTTEEAAALRRRIDVKDLLVFETTLATNASPPSFSQAENAALRLIAEDAADPFEVAIDVHRARMQKIRPLSVVGVGRQGQNGVERESGVIDALEEAPLLPEFDVELGENSDKVTDRVELWQRKLLNLTTSNRLLHVPDGGKVVRLACPDPALLEDRLADGKKIKIAPMPDLTSGGRDEKLYENQTTHSLREEVARAALDRNEVLSLNEKGKLEASLIDLYRKARSDLAEGGANTLFLSLGFLKWKKKPEDARSYRAPLILLPVKLERKSAISGVVMTQHEDEPRFNLTLIELLRQDFELSIPALEGALPTDKSGIDVQLIWNIMRTAVRDMPGFEVVPDVVLGTFSFAKYLMWKDLVDRADLLRQSPVVRHLIDREATASRVDGEFPKPEVLDDTVDPVNLFTPLPADSSQLSAVVASAKGHSFVLDGPPGTGKSQTIANMIAHNLALGRRVLFVAEKMAALDVVQRRLAEKGLGEYCLELHSAKATKVEVLKQLDRAWSVRETMSAEEWAREAAEAKRLRDTLNGVVRRLHARARNGLTIHHAIGRVVRDATAAIPRLSFATDADHSEDELVAMRDVARRLGLARLAIVGVPSELDALRRGTWSNQWQDDIAQVARATGPAIDRLVGARDTLLQASGLPLPADTADERAALDELIRVVRSTHGRNLRLAFVPDMADRVLAAREAKALLEKYRGLERRLSVPFASEAARRVPVDAIQSDWEAAGRRFWFLATLAQRKVARTLASVGGTSGEPDPATDLPLLGKMNGLLQEIDALVPRLANVSSWTGLSTDLDRMEIECALSEELKRAIQTRASDPDHLIALRSAVSRLVVDANELIGPDGALARAQDAFGAAVSAYGQVAQALETSGEIAPDMSHEDLRAIAAAVLANLPRLQALTGWQRVRAEALGLGMGPVVAALEEGQLAPAEARDAFEIGYAQWFARTRIDAEPLLSQFASGVHMDDIAAFQKIDDRLSQSAVRYIRAQLSGQIPPREETGQKDGYGVLKHQLQLKQRHKPIRQLATEMGDAFTRLAPCMLMSPLSIAQYLPADQALFDLVIFDEASQVTPWDAIGAMARGKQVVIAGDPRQMPPTNFFQRSAGATDEEGDVEEDMESILDECLGSGMVSHSLSWHYRSRHESLIAFSNHRYYESGLVTFPAPVTRASAVEWKRVDGVYARGKGRINQVEAKAMVDEAVSRLRDPAFGGAGKTLGIITLNADQQKLVEDLLDKARQRYPQIEPYFAESLSEPVVVKNLETVQGDERDLILLGIGFGPTEPGAQTMSMSFGALNNQGGWRRLNVAVTRARQEMVLFTSFDPGMIDLNRTSARAVADLKHFVEFADRGPRALAEAVRGSVGGYESPFEEAVSAELIRRGWQVVPQIGVSRFRIDLGIVHPDRPGDYLVGVECDGATYHSAATARDRDKVRQAILKGLGWDLVRVWSTDWWIDRQGAAEKLHLEIERLLEASRERAALEEEEKSVEPDVEDIVEVEQSEAVAIPRSAPPAEIEDEQPLLMGLPQHDISVPKRDGTGHYRRADFSGFSTMIDPDRFYEPDYDGVLIQLVGHAITSEAPISDTSLFQAIGQAHGFKRTGRIIRERVLAIVQAHFHAEVDDAGKCFVWPDAMMPDIWNEARGPATEADIRQIDDIALAELRVAAGMSSGNDVAVDVARHFGVRRLSVTARERIERAQARSFEGVDQ